jgi:hypothetical protein
LLEKRTQAKKQELHVENYLQLPLLLYLLALRYFRYNFNLGTMLLCNFRCTFNIGTPLLCNRWWFCDLRMMTTVLVC